MVMRRGARRTARRTSRRTSRRMNRRQSAYEAAAAPPPAAPAPAAPAEPASEDRYEALTKLAELHDSGVLTDAEFEKEKAKILHQG